MKITSRQKQIVGFALQELGKSFSCHEDNNEGFKDRVRKASVYLNEFIGEISPTPTLTESLANCSAKLHTYLRKGSDEPYAGILYLLVSQSRGMGIWLTFCENLGTSMNYRSGISKAKEVHNNGTYDSSDDGIMYYSLLMWGKDWTYVKEYFNIKQ